MFLREDELKVEKDSQLVWGQNKFEKKFRVVLKKDFNNLRVNPNKKTYQSFRVFWKPNNLDSSRIAVGVSRKVGNSVLRNKIKRITREKFRTSKTKSSGHDLLISANPKYFSSQSSKKTLIKCFSNELEKALLELK